MPSFKIMRLDMKSQIKLPVILDAVAAGLPSPAADFMEGKLDLNEHLISHPSVIFFVRVTGDSILEVNKSIS